MAMSGHSVLAVGYGHCPHREKGSYMLSTPTTATMKDIFHRHHQPDTGDSNVKIMAAINLEMIDVFEVLQIAMDVSVVSTDLLLLQQLCNSLDIHGEKTLVLSVNVSTNSCVTLGSDWGKEFTESSPAFRQQYQQFCEGKIRNLCKTESGYYEDTENDDNDDSGPFPVAATDNGGPCPTSNTNYGWKSTLKAGDNVDPSPPCTGVSVSAGVTMVTDAGMTVLSIKADDVMADAVSGLVKAGNTTRDSTGVSVSVTNEAMNTDRQYVSVQTDDVITPNVSVSVKGEHITRDCNVSKNIKIENAILELVEDPIRDNITVSVDEDNAPAMESTKKVKRETVKIMLGLPKGTKTEVKCDACGTKFSHKRSLYRHIHSDRCHILTEDKTSSHPFHCDSCRKPFHSEYSLHRHIREGRCRNPSDHQEIVRQKLLEQKQIFNEKRANRDPVTDLQCKICGKELSTKTNLTQHVKLSHNKERNHICHICGSAFQVKHALDVHLRAHTGDLPFICSFCGKGYRSKDSRQKHESSEHLNQKPYMCHICGKSYRQSGHLGLHQKRHNSEYKPVTCMHCPEKFRSYFALRRHILHEHKMEDLVSTASKLYYCDMCPKVFSDKKYIESHMNSHLGLRPHECGVCHKAFSDKSNLRQHQVTHEGKEHECDICGMRFSLIRNLKSHKLAAHDVRAMAIQSELC